ncbi:MAG: FapA family protein [Spirochaetaceae bacterium]|nr:FapA family protein [Spirochaetaceae bacterium]
MVYSLDDFREVLKSDLEQDRKRKAVEVWGKTIQQALREASTELDLPTVRLEYEVQTRGYAGLFGIFFKKEWRLLVYPSVNYSVTRLSNSEGLFSEEGEREVVQSKDGDFGIKLGKDGKVYVKVSSPVGEGNAVAVEDILRQAGSTRSLPNLDEAKLEAIVAAGQDEWVEIAEYEYNYSANSEYNVTVSSDDMKGYLTISSPKEGGASPDLDDIREVLKLAGIFFGVKEDVLEEIEKHPRYRAQIVIAEGEDARDGDNTKVEFLFETDFTKAVEEKKKQVKNDKVDLKDNSRIQSVHKGEVVARVLPPESGKPGHTVKGALLPAKDGVDVPVELGDNVVLSDDRTEVLATASGQALFVKGVVSVETINIINGDLKSHINFLGTLVIKGDVGDGYEVIANGDIHISGTVGRSKLRAGGNIYVDGGVNGHKQESDQSTDSGGIVCGKSFWGRFLQNCNLEVGEFVIVSDGILHSNVIAMRKVLCKGKRAAIVGGHIRASEEINAASLGSVSGTVTQLETGFDPRLKDDLNKLVEERAELERAFSEIDRSLNNWLQAVKGKKLPPDKKQRIEEMAIEKEQKEQQIARLSEKIKEKMTQINEREFAGKISASQRVQAGVKININDALYEVTSEYSKGVTFYESGGTIHTKNYEEIADDITRGK